MSSRGPRKSSLPPWYISGSVQKRRRHLGVARPPHQLDVVDERRAVGPLVGARQRRHAARRLEREGVPRLAVVRASRRQVLELRREEVPVVEHLLQARRDAAGIVGGREVARDDDELAVARAVLVGGELHRACSGRVGAAGEDRLSMLDRRRAVSSVPGRRSRAAAPAPSRARRRALVACAVLGARCFMLAFLDSVGGLGAGAGGAARRADVGADVVAEPRRRRRRRAPPSADGRGAARRSPSRQPSPPAPRSGRAGRNRAAARSSRAQAPKPVLALRDKPVATPIVVRAADRDAGCGEPSRRRRSPPRPRRAAVAAAGAAEASARRPLAGRRSPPAATRRSLLARRRPAAAALPHPCCRRRSRCTTRSGAASCAATARSAGGPRGDRYRARPRSAHRRR